MGRKAAKSSAPLLAGVMLWAGTLGTAAFAQEQPASAPAAKGVRVRRQVLVSLPDRQLAVLENGKLLRRFPVAVGAAASPSPQGQFEIVSRIPNPTYYHPGTVIPAGSDNPIGPRWLGLNQKGYGIHGTNQPRSVGRAASHGCIRLRNRDVVELFAMVRVGDTVEIQGERNEQLTLIFGGVSDLGSPAVAPAQPGPLAAASPGQ
jgi:lipoprotein-anchoring transpeptidase ErfK/SrfK